MTFVPSPQQQAYFDWIVDGSGNTIMEAVAGAGKTTTIVKGVELMRKVKPEGRVFLGAYNKKMGEELKSRVAHMGNMVSAKTFHSVGFTQLLFSYKNSHSLTLDGNKVRDIVGDLVNENPLLEDYAGAIPSIVSMAKQRGLGVLGEPLADLSDDVWEAMIYYFGLDEKLPEDADMQMVIKFATRVLTISNENLNVIDFDDMVYLPLVYNLRFMQYDWVLIDEAQDTNPTRREIARRLLKPGGRLVAVGDSYQAIFGFTGADNDSLELIAEQFNCSRMPLTVTYRCPKAIVDHARKWVDHIEAHESAPEGNLGAIEYDDLLGVVRPRDAILCRNVKPLVRTFFKLVRAGHSAKVEGRAIGEGLADLADRWKITNLNKLSDRLKTYMEKEVAKALSAKPYPREARAEAVTDQVETLFVLIDRAKEQGIDTVKGLVKMIRDIFADDVSDDSRMIVLCTAHRSKGLEWDRVFILGRAELMPSRFAVQDWQIKQEINLIYVAVTRAKQTLIEVNGIEKKGKARLAQIANMAQAGHE